MAKRRILKRDISYVAGDLFSEALFCKLYLPGVNSEKADVVMARVLDMQDEFIRRANRPDGKENKKRVKEYYCKLRADLQTEINAIATEIGELSKKKVKNDDSYKYGTSSLGRLESWAGSGGCA